MKPAKSILTSLAVIGACLWTATASAGDPPKAPAAGPAPSAAPAAQAPGATLAAQQKLAERLNAIRGQSLAIALSHNRAEWESLSPDQRSRFRQEALAFLSESPEKQEQLLKQYQKLVSLSPQKQQDYRQIAQWLNVVVDSMSAEERKSLLAMPPEQRAKALLARKAELIQQGKLPAEAASQPVE
jgi:hypothetical protein